MTTSWKRTTWVACLAVMLGAGVLAACDGNGAEEDAGTDTGVTGDAGPGDTGDTALDTGDATAETADGSADTADTTPRPGRLVLEPDELVFRDVAKGETATQTIDVRNIGGREVTVETIEVEEHERADIADGEFETRLTGGGEFPSTIGANVVETVEVTYAPTDYKADRATLTASTGGSEVADAEAAIQTVMAHPDVSGPDSIRFGTVPKGETRRREIIVYNRGTKRLAISNVEATGDEHVTVEFPRRSPTIRLDEGERFLFELVFSAPDTDKRLAQVQIESNDPDQMPYRIDVTANRPEPCMTASTEAIDFGAIGAGEGTEEFGILNCNRERNLTIDAISMLTDGSGAFVLEQAPSFPTTVQPGQEIRMRVAADLEEARETYGNIVVRSDDPEKSPLLIEVRANVGQ